MPNTILQIQHLTKRYGDVVAVNDLSLEVYEGEVFGFLGPNGAGKTTSINMMCGLLRPDAGMVLIQGKPVNNGADVRSSVGVCPQNTVLWGKLTCLEQLEFVGEMYGVARKAARQRGEQLLAAMGLAEKRHKLAGTLSGGMQRRLNLILGLVHDPQILVLDEPEAGLDPQSRVMLREYVRTWASAQGKTVILTTHNMDEAERLARRVAIIDHGQLLVVDTPEALKQRIGEGDVLELELNGNGSNHNHSVSVEQARALLASLVPQVNVLGNALVLRSTGMVDLLPVILTALQNAGFRPGEIRLRANTLEDVFISLTGRRLRE